LPVSNYNKIPVHIEASLQNELERLVIKVGINRTKLIRMFIKFGLTKIEEVKSFGDIPPEEVIKQITQGKRK